MKELKVTAIKLMDLFQSFATGLASIGADDSEMTAWERDLTVSYRRSHEYRNDGF